MGIFSCAWNCLKNVLYTWMFLKKSVYTLNLYIKPAKCFNNVCLKIQTLFHLKLENIRTHIERSRHLYCMYFNVAKQNNYLKIIRLAYNSSEKQFNRRIFSNFIIKIIIILNSVIILKKGSFKNCFTFE